MSNIFEFRQEVINEYASFSRSFTRIQASDISTVVDAEYAKGRYWPEPLIQINPNYRRGKDIDQLVAEGLPEGLRRAGPDQRPTENKKAFSRT